MFTPLFRKIHQINRVKEYPNAFLLIFLQKKQKKQRFLTYISRIITTFASLKMMLYETIQSQRGHKDA